MRIDKTTGAVLRTPQQASGLYTYSDFTGYELRNYTAPHGTWIEDFQGCADISTWKLLSWTATVPANTTLQVFVRVADTQAGLADNSIARSGPFTTSPIDLDAAGVPHKQFLRLFFELTSTDGLSTPVLSAVNLTWGCTGIIR
jgi:hypothetical protein